jgi:tetratricopeptide (TPR) repeat protein
MAITLLCLLASEQTTASNWNNKGIDLYDQGKDDEDIQAYDMAIELDPQDADAWNAKGIALEELDLRAGSNATFAKA